MTVIKKLLPLALLALIPLTPAHAQQWTSGSGVTRTWTLTPTVPSVTATLPADAFEPADVADSGFTESQWISVTDGTTDYVKCGTSACEKKIRILCEPSFASQFDAILGKGIFPFGHRHQFAGNANGNQNSTFTTLRASPSATCDGGPLNGTMYWEPELVSEQYITGYLVGVRQQNTTFYYINGTQDQANGITWLRRDTAFIGGVNPADPEDAARRTEYSVAGLLYPGSPQTSAGFAGWYCQVGGSNVTVSHTASRLQTDSGTAVTDYARHLKDVDGSDPWGGACTGTVLAPAKLILSLIAPGCWDGTNERAPNGRDHMAYAARTADNAHTNLCPNNWVHIPVLTAKSEFDTLGFSEYGNWSFSSDRMHAATPTCPDATVACSASLDPCRKVSINYCNGATGHFDWMFGWKSAIIDEWERECLGIPVRGTATTNGPAECNTGQISKFRKLIYGGASPDSTMSGGCATINSCSNAVPGNVQRFNPIPVGTALPGTVLHQSH